MCEAASATGEIPHVKMAASSGGGKCTCDGRVRPVGGWVLQGIGSHRVKSVREFLEVNPDEPAISFVPGSLLLAIELTIVASV